MDIKSISIITLYLVTHPMAKNKQYDFKNIPPMQEVEFKHCRPKVYELPIVGKVMLSDYTLKSIEYMMSGLRNVLAHKKYEFDKQQTLQEVPIPPIRKEFSKRTWLLK